MNRLLFFIFIFCFTRVCGQEVYFDKPIQFVTEFPFKQLTGGVILIKAQLNEISDSFNFILDTGSGGISLDSTTAEEYDIPHIPSGRYIYGIAGIRKVDYSQNNSLSFPGLKEDSLDFYINDYEILANVYGIKIDGIIGYSFLRRYVVQVNFDSMKISVFKPGIINYPPHGFLLRPQLRGIPIIPLAIKDATRVNMNYYFDTGAGLCFLINNQLAKDSSVFLKRRKPVPVKVQGLGGKTQMHLTVIKELQIGNYKFRKVPTYILDDEYKLFSYPALGGLIGNDILRRFNLTINYPQREIHLLPNTHFRDLFDYSYTGMTLYFLDGHVVADDIIEGSPADRAGVKAGDVVVSINNNFSNNVETYKNLLQKVGDRASLLIMRNNVPMQLSLRVGRIR